jgi:hypothetical protein
VQLAAMLNELLRGEPTVAINGEVQVLVSEGLAGSQALACPLPAVPMAAVAVASGGDANGNGVEVKSQPEVKKRMEFRFAKKRGKIEAKRKKRK